MMIFAFSHFSSSFFHYFFLFSFLFVCSVHTRARNMAKNGILYTHKTHTHTWFSLFGFFCVIYIHIVMRKKNPMILPEFWKSISKYKQWYVVRSIKNRMGIFFRRRKRILTIIEPKIGKSSLYLHILHICVLIGNFDLK